MSFNEYDNGRYNYTFTPADDEAARRAAQEEEHKKEMSRLRRSMIRIVAGICVLTLVLGIGGGALVGSMVAKNTRNAETPAVVEAQRTTPAEAGQTTLPETTTAEEKAPETTTAFGTTAAAEPAKRPAIAGNLYAISNDQNAEMSSADVYELVSDSVVSILTEYQNGAGYYQQSTSSGAGSGVIISEDGYIVTNNHVVANAVKITVALSDGTEYEATLIGTDDITDIALLKIEASGLTYAVIGDSASLRIGETANVIGNPLGRLSGTLTVGVISGLDRAITMSDGTTMNLIQMDAAVNPGNSGGGVFNSAGELVGVTVAKTSATEVEGLGFAIPVNDVLPILDELMAHGYVSGRPALGINAITISDQFTAMMYRVNYLGVYVRDVLIENGLKVGDYFVSIDGQEIKGTSDINAVLQNHKAGDTVEVVVYREGKEETVNVTLVEEGTLKG